MNILKILTPARIKGNIGERTAAKYLRKKKYKILSRNYVAKNKEIDIIAENKQTVIFVEVKTRTENVSVKGEPRPASAVTPDKQRDIITVAKYYIAAQKINKRIRFDVIEVLLNENKKALKINHLENTFNLNSANRRH
jgi:putative endonuclease